MSRTVFWRCFAVLLVVDLVLVLGYVVALALRNHGVIAALPDWISLWSSTSLTDRVQYTKWLMASMLLVVAWQRGRRPLMGAGAVVFTLLLADDSLELHEAAGHILARALHLPKIGGLRSNDLGELIAFAVIGLVALGLFLAARRRSDKADRRLVTGFALIFAGLAVFALSMDMASIALASRIPHESPLHYVTTLTSILDDAVELVMASLILAFAMAVATGATVSRPLAVTPRRRIKDA